MAQHEVRTALAILLASAALAACGGASPPQTPAAVTTTGASVDYSPSEPTLTSMSRVAPTAAPADAGAAKDELPNVGEGR